MCQWQQELTNFTNLRQFVWTDGLLWVQILLRPAGQELDDSVALICHGPGSVIATRSILRRTTALESYKT